MKLQAKNSQDQTLKTRQELAKHDCRNQICLKPANHSVSLPLRSCVVFLKYEMNALNLLIKMIGPSGSSFTSIFLPISEV